MAAYLVLSDGHRIEVEDGMVIGRVKGCAVVINDTKASRRHARVIAQGGVVEIEDLESSNGTLLNGKPVTRRMLRDGDVVRIGTTEITFQASAAAAPAGGGLDAGEDLFGDEEDDGPAPPPVAAAPPPASLPGPSPAPSRPVPAASPPADPFEPVVEVRGAPAAPEVVEEVLEFADDEVVTVKRSLPGRGTRPGQPAPAPVRDGGVLQFNKVESKGGFAAQDLAQMSPAMRALLIVGVLAGAAAVCYGVAQLVSG